MIVSELVDQHVRQRLLDELETTFFVEAGAGTGKTTALVTRIVELVARDDLPMERLAAITFTAAAAAELRDRLRAALEQAAVTRSSQAERCTQPVLTPHASRVQELPSLQSTAVPGAHAPPRQWSPDVHALLSLQGLLFGG